MNRKVAEQPSERPLRVALAQINSEVGSIDANVARILGAIEEARSFGADLVVFPELAVLGYPPEDLLLRPWVVRACEAAVEVIALETAGLTAVVGSVVGGIDLFNVAAVLHDGRVIDMVAKRFLPNYGVFDEVRYFQRGTGSYAIFDRGDMRFGVTICEDMWQPDGPAGPLALAGADLLINLSASPYVVGKGQRRARMFATRAEDHGCYVLFCNQVGGQDELVFDGGSLVVGPDGTILARGRAFEEDVVVAEIHAEDARHRRLLAPRHRAVPPDHPIRGISQWTRLDRVGATDRPSAPPAEEVRDLGPEEEVYTALVRGVRDYAAKNGFSEAVVGLSGGIDSALTASIAVDALGAANVVGVAMPTRYSSRDSLADAQLLAESMAIRLLEVPIDGLFQSYLDLLDSLPQGRGSEVTEENLQPRIRGNLLMALSNTHGYLVLTTGNKSETSVGFTTLYGDTAGGFAPLKDLFKLRVYALARWRNETARKPWIPERSLTRAPSPELKPNQTDQDVLPPYSVLDPILEGYVEGERSAGDLIARGYDERLVRWVAARVDASEYKRRQSPPGIKITERAFGRDRRMPISRGRAWPE